MLTHPLFCYHYHLSKSKSHHFPASNPSLVLCDNPKSVISSSGHSRTPKTWLLCTTSHISPKLGSVPSLGAPSPQFNASASSPPHGSSGTCPEHPCKVAPLDFLHDTCIRPCAICVCVCGHCRNPIGPGHIEPYRPGG